MMRKKLWMLIVIVTFLSLAACGNNNEKKSEESADDELKTLEVEFEVPETADVDETVELKAIVTYGDEKVKDADKVEFEFWEKGKKDDSTKIESKNNEDGTYVAETSFDKDGVYEIYAHVTAEGLHTMPKKSITVGDGTTAKSEENQHDEAGGHEHGSHVEGFAMHFMKPDVVKVDQKTDFTVHLQMNDDHLENAHVRFEIWNEDNEGKHEWIETEESSPGEYIGTYTFQETGSYTVTIHVENDEGLHEHEDKQINVTN